MSTNGHIPLYDTKPEVITILIEKRSIESWHKEFLERGWICAHQRKEKGYEYRTYCKDKYEINLNCFESPKEDTYKVTFVSENEIEPIISENFSSLRNSDEDLSLILDAIANPKKVPLLINIPGMRHIVKYLLRHSIPPTDPRDGTPEKIFQ